MAQNEIHTSSTHSLVGQLEFTFEDETFSSSSLDTQLFEAVEFYISPNIDLAPPTMGVDFVLQDSPDNSVWTDVTQEFTVGDLAQQRITWDVLPENARLGYVGSERYVRISGTSDDGQQVQFTLFVIGVMAHARNIPTSDARMPLQN